MKILIADPDPTTQSGLQQLLAPLAEEVHVTSDGDEAVRIAVDRDVDLVISEVNLPGRSGMQVLETLHELRPDTAVILLAAFGTVEDAVSAIRQGAADYLSKPFSEDQLRLSVDRSALHTQLLRQNEELREALGERSTFDNCVAHDPAMAAIFKTLRAVAKARTTVLLTGESGTGKTRIARAIHRMSDRAHRPFIEVNCGALPETLLESELFGHVKGAFTGAVRDRPGRFEAADGGTIFLDEIGTSSPSFQVRLLRVLQDRVVERVGDTATLPVDVRVVLATNQDLRQAVADGTFREDLYYRIHVVAVELPPLRDRRADLPLLAEHFLQRLAKEIGKPVRGFSPEALRMLLQAPFPGNVRQLENAIERAVVLCEGDTVRPDDLPPDLLRSDDKPGGELVPDGVHLLPLKDALEIPEKLILERALAAHDGNRQQTAASLGINRSTLFNKMRKYGLL